jgi:hypothetical protein
MARKSINGGFDGKDMGRSSINGRFQGPCLNPGGHDVQTWDFLGDLTRYPIWDGEKTSNCLPFHNRENMGKFEIFNMTC